MRAMAIREHGAPSVLRMEERPVPDLRDTDILVEVHASSVNPVDTKVRQRSGNRELPITLGYDVSGVIVHTHGRAIRGERTPGGGVGFGEFPGPQIEAEPREDHKDGKE